MKFDHAKHLPKNGPTGSLVVDASLDLRSGDQIVQLPHPVAPTRSVEAYDVDGEWITDVQLSDVEFDRRMKNYRLALKEWNRTGGMCAIAGSPLVSARVTCVDGTMAKGIWNDSDDWAGADDERWRWIEWRT